MLSPDATSLEVKDVLQCDDEEAKNHLKTFFEVMNTSSQHVTYTSGTQHGLGWCMDGACRGALGYICGVWGEGVLAVTGCHAAVLSTAPSSVSGLPYRDWRCLARHVGLRVSNLQATSSETRLGIILEEWARMETVTVAKLHEVLIKSQCMRAAGCLAKGSAAHVQSTMNQEEEDGILDFGDESDESC